jgi:hypothetical protein
LSPWTLFFVDVVDEGGSERKSMPPSGPSTFFASVSPSSIAPLPNCFLCFSQAIMYVIAQKKQLGSGAIADGETDAKTRV